MRILDYYHTDKLTHDEKALRYSRTAQALKSEPAGKLESFMLELEAAMNSQPDTVITEAAKLYTRTAQTVNKPLGNFEALRNSKPDAEIAQAAKLYSRAKENNGHDSLLSGLAQDYLRAKNTLGRYDAVFANSKRDSEALCV